jgi:hypothetical protein
MLLDQLVKRDYLEIVEDSKIDNEACPPTKCAGCPKIITCDDLLKAKYKLVK